MYKKILLCGMIGILSNYSYAARGDLDKRKITLTADILKQVSNCKCLIDKIDRKEKLFPLKEKPNVSKTGINTQVAYLETIASLKISTGRFQTRAKAVLSKWPMDKNSPEDLKKLDSEVTQELQGMATTCNNVVNAIADEIYKRSSIFTRKKINPKECGIVQNK